MPGTVIVHLEHSYFYKHCECYPARFAGSFLSFSSIHFSDISQYRRSISMPVPLRSQCDAATSVEPLPIKGSSTVSPTNEKSFIHRSGSSTGNGAGCPTFVFLSPLNVQSPFVQAINSARVMSEVPDPLVFFQRFL